jgi:ADP-ribosylglycohydrolase
MALCNLHSILEKGIDNEDLMTKFLAWYRKGYMTPYGYMFDIGGTTRTAINKFQTGVSPVFCGGSDEHSNGNGSLMRILPLSLYIHRLNPESIVGESFANSGLTHGHQRSLLCCAYFSLLVKSLQSGADLNSAMDYASNELKPYMMDEQALDRILSGEIVKLPEEDISGSGYVVHCLETSLWCVANSSSYSEAVFKAINLGNDTDTTAAVTGAIAGSIYGVGALPNEWLKKLARYDELKTWINQFTDKILSESLNRHQVGK